MSKPVIVFCQSPAPGGAKTWTQVLGLGRETADAMGVELIAAAGADLAEEVAINGPDRVIAAGIPDPSPAVPGPWFASFLKKACEEIQPQAVLMAHTPLGQDLAPRLARQLDTWLVTDAVKVTVSEKRLLVKKPVQGGVAMATYSFNCSPALVTVRERVGKACEENESKAAPITRLDVPAPSAGGEWEVVDRVEEAGAEIKLEESNIVVSGGRGIGGPEGFETLEKLAAEIGAAVGASRPPCDAGWTPPGRQVGITGKIISPEVYVAVAISGASQHLSGMCDSRKIIAINRDPEAEIFKVADFGVVGDYKKVVPALLAALKKGGGEAA